MLVSILGCGWLGLPLAKSLLAEGYTIKGSTTTDAKLSILQQDGIEPCLISLSEEGPVGDIAAFLESSEVLVIDIPPKLRGENSESYIDKVQNLIPYIKGSGIAKVLFVSSTSVYADDNSVVTEETIPQPDTEGGRQLLETEKLLQSNIAFQTTVLRFGGLIGEDRHPVKYLAGKTNLPNPNAPVNLIHRDDCIGIIKAIITKVAWGETFNGVAPFHPTRKEYYTKKAVELGLPLPVFDNQASKGKIIESLNVESMLSYRFTHSL